MRTVVFTIITVMVSAMPLSARGAQTVWVVRDGRAVSAAFVGDIWTSRDGALTGEGKDNPLLAGAGLGRGDFRISATLRIVNQRRSGASFSLDGNHLGFEGSDETLFVNGKAFDGLSLLAPSASVFERGDWFEFQVVRTNDVLRYTINGREVYSFKYGDRPIARIGFYPLRGTYQIKQFRIEGALTETPARETTLTFSEVFHAGREGYHTYRIPSLVTTRSGSLLAFAEGRASRHDHASNDLVLKKSTDGGMTWSAVRTLVEDGDHCMSNPTATVLSDGRVLLVYTRYAAGFDEKAAVPGYDGEGVVRAFVMQSDDDGETWSVPREITRSVKRPTDVTSIASGPGNGIELRHGAHRGRILVPFNEGPHGQWRVYAAYSDDGGRTWAHGQTAQNPVNAWGNEVQLVELADGRVMLNSRMQPKGAHYRGVAVSSDGGETWSPITLDDNLIDPACQGSILRFTDPADGYRGRLLFSNPGSTSQRADGTVYLSYDDGATWPAQRVIWPDHFAYSSLTKINPTTVGCLFETWRIDESRPANDRMVFSLVMARFPIGWLASGQDGFAVSADPPASIDLAGEKQRRVIIDRQDGQYLGHPTTVLLEDGRTMLVVYPMGHGRGQVCLKRSTDGGATWSPRLPVPASWSTGRECPSIHRVVDRDGTRRLIVFSGLYPIRMSVSQDDGETWSELEPIGDYGGIVAMSSVIELEPGRYMALFHDDGRFLRDKRVAGAFTIYAIVSDDGGLTWSQPRAIAESADILICEPGVVRSPDGKEMAVMLRENGRNFNAFVIRSFDNGETWTPPMELPASLTGDRHVARYAPDGRLVVVFRDMALGSGTWGDFIAWVGTYDDLVSGRDGQYHVRLLDNQSNPYDTGYAGLELLPDGTLVATTYCVLSKGEQPLVVATRFHLDELDAR